MRSLISILGVVAFTIAMIVAVPTLWATGQVVSADGFAKAASKAAHQREVQEFFADQIAEAAVEYTDLSIAGSAVKPLATKYTESSQFVTDFTEVARQQHAWLFNAPKPGASLHEMQLDITPMINKALSDSPVPLHVDDQVIIDVDQNRLTAGSLEQTGKQITLSGWISAVIAAIAGLLALVVANRRIVILAWLGIGTFLAGVVGLLISKYLVSEATNSIAASEVNTQQTIKVVANDVLAGLTTASWVVTGVGGAVAVIGAVGAVALSRRT